jgi:sugar porter (SP) family MFS transporter
MTGSAYLYYSIAAHAIGSASFGYHIGELNPIALSLSCNYGADKSRAYGPFRDCIPLTELQIGTVVAIFAAGGLVGSFSAGTLINRYGRRKISRLNCFIFIASGLLMAAAETMAALVAGRLLAGVGSGVSMVTVPIYLAEVAPKNIRGTVGVVTQISIVIGILLVQVIGVFAGRRSLWRYILLVGAGLGFSQWLLLSATVESPKWLALQPGKMPAAHTALRKLRGSDDVDDELRSWKASMDNSEEAVPDEGDLRGLSLRSFLLERRYRPALRIILISQLAQQLTGVNAVNFYSTTILSRMLPTMSAWIAVLIQVVNLLVTLLAARIIEKTGRRILLLTSLSGMCLCSLLLCVGLVKSLSLLSATSAVAMIGSFGIGLGPLPFMLANELLEVKAVGHAQSLGLSINWIGTFLVGLLFPVLRRVLGGKGSQAISS